MSTLTKCGIFWAISSLLVSVATGVGYYMPYWLRGHLIDQDVFFGVFRRCNYPEIDKDGDITIVKQCGRYSSFDDIPSLWWKIATLAVGIGCALSFLIALVIVLAICIRGIISPKVAKVAGILQLCAGFIIGCGIAIYPNGWDVPEVKQTCGNISSPYQLGGCSLYWAFYLTAAGGGALFFLSLLSCHASESKRSRVYDE